MAVLILTLAPLQHRSLVRQEHGRTIPLAVVRRRQGCKHPSHNSTQFGHPIDHRNDRGRSPAVQLASISPLGTLQHGPKTLAGSMVRISLGRFFCDARTQIVGECPRSAGGELFFGDDAAVEPAINGRSGDADCRAVCLMVSILPPGGGEESAPIGRYEVRGRSHS